MEQERPEEKQCTKVRRDAPSTRLINTSTQPMLPVVKTPRHTESFTRVGEPVQVYCAVTNTDSESNYFGDVECTPLPRNLEYEIELQIRPVALHPLCPAYRAAFYPATST